MTSRNLYLPLQNKNHNKVIPHSDKTGTKNCVFSCPVFSPLTRLNCSMIFLHICYSLKCKASATEPGSSYPCVLGQSLAKCYPCNLGYFHSFFFFFIYFNWRLITLQYCNGFCQNPKKWVLPYTQVN